MADNASEENLDEACNVREPDGSGQSSWVSEDAGEQSVTSTDEASSLHVTKSPIGRLLSNGPYQGPHDWRKCLKPVTNLERLGNGGGDRKIKSPDGTRQRLTFSERFGADTSTVYYDRSVML